MWFDNNRDGVSWSVLWHGYVRCFHCGGIRRIEGNCPACDQPDMPQEHVLLDKQGQERRVLATHTGAEDRYEDWVYLDLLEREWKRPIGTSEIADTSHSTKNIPSRVPVVLIFWSYFETRFERLLRVGMGNTPPLLIDDILDRYSSIGSRFDRLYGVLFGSTYSRDLTDVGYPELWSHICTIQEKRNAFIHGNPSAITEPLIVRVVEELKNEHEAWIAVFNKHKRRIYLDAMQSGKTHTNP